MLGGDETGERDGGCLDRWRDGYEVKDGEGASRPLGDGGWKRLIKELIKH